MLSVLMVFAVQRQIYESVYDEPGGHSLLEG